MTFVATRQTTSEHVGAWGRKAHAGGWAVRLRDAALEAVQKHSGSTLCWRMFGARSNLA